MPILAARGKTTAVRQWLVAHWVVERSHFPSREDSRGGEAVAFSPESPCIKSAHADQILHSGLPGSGSIASLSGRLNLSLSYRHFGTRFPITTLMTLFLTRKVQHVSFKRTTSLSVHGWDCWELFFSQDGEMWGNQATEKTTNSLCAVTGTKFAASIINQRHSDGFADHRLDSSITGMGCRRRLCLYTMCAAVLSERYRSHSLLTSDSAPGLTE